MKVPFDRIAPEANKLFDKITTAKNMEEVSFWYSAYVSLLERSGWDVNAFEELSAKKVDEGWEETKPIVWN